MEIKFIENVEREILSVPAGTPRFRIYNSIQTGWENGCSGNLLNSYVESEKTLELELQREVEELRLFEESQRDWDERDDIEIRKLEASEVLHLIVLSEDDSLWANVIKHGVGLRV